jgi:hypothetical protein
MLGVSIRCGYLVGIPALIHDQPDQVGLKPSWTADRLRVLDDDDIVHLLRAAVKREGSQAAFARRHGVDRGTMNSILNGKRRVTATLLKVFGLRKVYVINDYEVLSGLGVSNLSTVRLVSALRSRAPRRRRLEGDHE